MALVLIKYIMLEGRYRIFQASHFFLLNHFIFSNIDRVNFPYFIFNFMAILVSKIKQNGAWVPLHELIIKLVYDEVMVRIPNKYPIITIRVGGKVFE